MGGLEDLLYQPRRREFSKEFVEIAKDFRGLRDKSHWANDLFCEARMVATKACRKLWLAFDAGEIRNNPIEKILCQLRPPDQLNDDWAWYAMWHDVVRRIVTAAPMEFGATDDLFDSSWQSDEALSGDKDEIKLIAAVEPLRRRLYHWADIATVISRMTYS